MSNDLLYFDLNTGGRIPSVGLGTWQSPLGEVYNAVITAVKVKLQTNPIHPFHWFALTYSCLILCVYAGRLQAY